KKKGGFLFYVTLLTGGTVIGQGLFVLISPLLSRLYSPEAFGDWGVFVSTAGLLASVATLRYELAIPLPEKEEDAQALAWVGALVAIGFSVVLFGLSFWIGADYLQLFNIQLANSEQKRLFLLALPFGVGTIGLYQVLVYLLIRYKRYRALAASKVALGGSAVAQLGLGVWQNGGWGLIVGWILGRVVAIGVGLGMERSDEGDKLMPVFPGFQALWRQMRRFIRFPLLSMPAGLMNASAVEMPLLMSASLFDSQVTGWFSFARRVMYAPVNLLGRSVSQVYVGALSEAINRRDRSALRLFDRLSRRLFLLAVIPFTLLALTAPSLFRWVFGPAWYTSGVLVRYLTPLYLVHFVVVPLSQTLNLVERQDWQMAWDFSRLVLVVGVFILAKFLDWDFVRTFAVYSLVSTLMYLAFYVLMRRALIRRVSV
ncbi:MAG: oligosaccharide flippase family protein, partial [Gammaproteobacteria bacterium]|nr:oligosaccharide flippase family protein [Gammaproteobacteria bacterium]